MKKRFRWWYIPLILILAVLAAAVIYLQPYQPNKTAKNLLKSDSSVIYTDEKDWISFKPSAHKEKISIIYYPGALVKPESYSPFAYGMAKSGYNCYIIKMPLNLAVLGGDKAMEVIKQNPSQLYVIGGHSLGGVMSSRFAADHQKQIAGAFFLASYPDEKGSLLKKGIPVLSITGSNDGVMKRDSYEKSKSFLPGNTFFYEIKGGNHGQFGSYGPQKGDQKASISAEQQMREIVDTIKIWLQEKILSK